MSSSDTPQSEETPPSDEKMNASIPNLNDSEFASLNQVQYTEKSERQRSSPGIEINCDDNSLFAYR